MAPSISVVFPMWNEEAYIQRAVSAARAALEKAVPDHEIIVVNDASTDRTGELADALARADPRVKVAHHEANRKLGATLRTGYALASKDLILYSDADLPFDFEEVERAVRLLEYQHADVVSAYRFDRTSEGLLRTVYTIGYSALIRTVFRLRFRDINFSFKLFRRALLDRIVLKSEGSFIDAEFLVRAKKAGAHVIQIGVDYFPRTRGQSTLASPGVILGILKEMAGLWRELGRDDMLIDLAQTSVAPVIRRLSVERRSGDLQVRSGKLVKIAFFDHGRLVFAASNLKKDRLGEALVALGRITDEDFSRVSALMKGDRKRRFGEALVASGVMDKSEMGTAVARQVRRIAVSLFELHEGAASFEERRCTIPLDYMVSCSVSRILYEGTRLLKNQAAIQSALEPLDRGVILAAVPPFSFDPKECPPEERDILELARKRVTVRRLAWASGGLALSRLRATYALWSAGVLQDVDAKDAPQPVTQMETGTFLLSTLQRQKDPSAQEAIRQEVQDELDRSSKMDRETWLKVARSAPREELLKALEEKMERYHALREAVSDDEQIKTDIEVILGRASAMLRLAKQAPAVAPVAAPPPAPAPPRAPSPPKAVSPPKPAPAPSSARPAAPPPPEVEQEMELELEPEAVAEPETSEIEVPIERAAEAPAAEASAPAFSRSPGIDDAAGPGNTTFEGRARLEHLLMEGEVRMTVSDYANAIKVYEKLVEAAPKVPGYRMRLAVAMACYPRTAKQAERQFVEAMRLDPDNGDYHYQFGLYFKAMKVKSRAVAEMRAAVRLDPRHQAARQELESLSPKDSVLGSLRNLFK